MILDIDGTFFVILISFIIFAVIMHKIFYLPLRSTLEERDNYINGHFQDAKDARDNARKIVEDYNSKILRARLDSQNTVEQMADKGKKERSEIVKNASQEANSHLTGARQDLQSEKDKAFDSLKSHVPTLAQQIVSKILGAEVALSGLDQDKINKILKG